MRWIALFAIWGLLKVAAILLGLVSEFIDNVDWLAPAQSATDFLVESASLYHDMDWHDRS